MIRPSVRRCVAIALVACTALAACGDDDDTASPSTAADTTTTTTTEATMTTADPAAAEAEIGDKTSEFFRLIGVGEFDQAVTILENGPDYLDELAHCQELVGGVTIEMQEVELDGETATSFYDILINGEVVLERSSGVAVLTDDGWIVGENTFLSLYDAAKDSCTGPAPAET